MTRRQIREHIFKLLFQTEFYNEDEFEEQADSFFDSLVLENDEDADSEKMMKLQKDYAMIRKKTKDIFDHIEEIDLKINEKSVGWKTSRMGKVELTILRLGVYEILMDDDIPQPVAINEAVELAKKFGEDNASSFVNGILAKFAS